MLIHQTDGHKLVRLQHVELKVVALDIEPRALAHLLQHRIGQTALGPQLWCGERLRHLCGRLGQRHQTRTRLLRQAFEQGLDFVFEHSRHQPLATVFANLVEYK